MIIAGLLISCSSEKTDEKGVEKSFINKAKHFHELYITAGDCSERNAMIDPDIIFMENGQPFTYSNLLEYCSYIKPKNDFKFILKTIHHPTNGRLRLCRTISCEFRTRLH